MRRVVDSNIVNAATIKSVLVPLEYTWDSIKSFFPWEEFSKAKSIFICFVAVIIIRGECPHANDWIFSLLIME